MILPKKQDGFTLWEVLIAVAIVATMGALVGPRLMNYFKRGQETVTKTSLQNLKSALTLYYADKGSYPTTREGLEALVPEYMDEKGIKDGWKRDFEYNCPPQKFESKFKHYEIISYGADGEKSGEEPNMDFVVGQ